MLTHLSTRTILATAAIGATIAVGGAVSPASASASCGGFSVLNKSGRTVSLWGVTPHNGMRCSSARYVVNGFLRPAVQRRYSSTLPRYFFDGYVNWSCRRTGRYRWRCREYTTYTYFTFGASVAR